MVFLHLLAKGKNYSSSTILKIFEDISIASLKDKPFWPIKSVPIAINRPNPQTRSLVSCGAIECPDELLCLLSKGETRLMDFSSPIKIMTAFRVILGLS